MTGGGGAASHLVLFNPEYFDDATWSDRVIAYMESRRGVGFDIGNLGVVERLVADADAGLRVVVNIGTFALLKLARGEPYKNLYERPVIGNEAKEESPTREKVDALIGIDGPTTYFGAVALGGAGVRYYGEYCMVLEADLVTDDTGLFDRDSYDVLIAPLADLAPDVLERLKGRWGADRAAMVTMRVLPDLIDMRQLVTTGTISELVLKDQEFIEAHLTTRFGLDQVEEVRESPDEVAIEARLQTRAGRGAPTPEVEHQWLARRRVVALALDQADARVRVVTQHGRGYQWK